MTAGRLPRCRVCSSAPVAMRGVAFCFTCWPGGPVTPPPCLRCGSTQEYYASGLCARCHPQAVPAVDACRDCYAWGATAAASWLCLACRAWRRNYPAVAACPTCTRTLALGRRGSCRLCYRQAVMLREPDAHLDVVTANRHGQQLFLADMVQANTNPTPRSTAEGAPPAPTRRAPLTEQLVLFQMRRDLAAHGRTGLHLRADPARYAALEPVLAEAAAAGAWNARHIKDTTVGLRIVLGLQDNPTAPIKATDVTLLKDIDLCVWTVLEVLTRAGQLLDDRAPALDTWYAEQTRGLPEPMASQLATWFQIMKDGSLTPPRRRPRQPGTITLHVRWALPTLRTWAAAGHHDLREITKAHILDALPPSGNERSTTGQGLKSIFRLLKARKTLFADPTTRLKTGGHAARQPLPVNLDTLRAALASAKPATAAVVALLAFHGLRIGHLRRMLLTDARDGRLHIDGRTIVLAPHARQRLATYLTHRSQSWPATTNPYLFINKHSARRGAPVSHRWLRLAVGPELTPTAIREDRILHETLATHGDVRAMTDLFGLSVNALTRYTATLDHPDLTAATRTQPPD